jgi:hypothetical protein
MAQYLKLVTYRAFFLRIELSLKISICQVKQIEVANALKSILVIGLL